jgi:tryptophan synthase, alpha subunit
MKKNFSDKISELRERGEGALVTFITAGDQNKDLTVEYLKALCDSADILELGIPFSDPVADGKTIQAADIRALKNDFRVADTFEIVERFKEESEKPLVLMTYYNSIYVRGMEKFLLEAKRAGADGLIIVDLPVEEGREYIERCRELNLQTIFLSAPNTSDERMKEIDHATSGFLYLISLYGTTGARDEISKEAFLLLKRAKRICKNPLCVGFGISNPKDAESLIRAGADGVVVGSAFVNIIGEKRGREETVIKLKKKAEELKDVLKRW